MIQLLCLPCLHNLSGNGHISGVKRCLMCLANFLNLPLCFIIFVTVFSKSLCNPLTIIFENYWRALLDCSIYLHPNCKHLKSRITSFLFYRITSIIFFSWQWSRNQNLPILFFQNWSNSLSFKTITLRHNSLMIFKINPLNYSLYLTLSMKSALILLSVITYGFNCQSLPHYRTWRHRSSI